MARSSVRFVCSSCGFESGKWYGKCPECGNWNTLEEVSVPESISRGLGKSSSKNISISRKEIDSKVQKISQIKSISEERISSGFEEFDRVLGSSGEKNSMGIVPGSVILLSGDP